jgi:hypothetical protein
MNSVLKFLPPLIVAIMLLNEPLVGSLIGAALGVSGVPGAWTWVRGELAPWLCASMFAVCASVRACWMCGVLSNLCAK